MASLDSLPADQRAVLQLVLRRGRSYDEIAQLLSIDNAAVRERALSALAAVGPATRVPSERRAEISDYLLGQLPSAGAKRVRDRIAESATERAWARVVASELAPLAAGSLPEIPLEAAPRGPQPSAAAEPQPDPSTAPELQGESSDAPEPATIAREPVVAAAPAEAATTSDVAKAMGLGGSEPRRAPRSSRTGGAILLGAGALVAILVVAVVIVLVAGSGGSSSSHSTATAASATTSASASTSTPATSTGAARPIAQVNLTSPTHNKNIAGVAEIIKQGSKEGLVIVAQGVPANSNHDAYAVWLYNSPSDSHRLGFVNPGVKTDGKLQTAGLLPANAAHFKRLLVTLETQAKPPGPGKIVLRGALKVLQ